MARTTRQFAKGDEVEVRSSEGMLKEWWHLAWIVGCHGDSYCVYYLWKVNGADMERVPADRIRPRPPAVEFSNWSRGDLVQAYDTFIWKLATVTEVLVDVKQLMVRVLGSNEDLVVRVARARVRHNYDRQRDTWTIVGKGPSENNVRESQQKKRSAPSGPGEGEAGRESKRICTANAAALNYEKQDDSVMSSSGSCSVNSDGSSHFFPTKDAESYSADDYASDAESCTGPNLTLCLYSCVDGGV